MGSVSRFCLYAAVGTVIGIAGEQRSCAVSAVTPPPKAASWSLAAPLDCERPVPARFQIWQGTANAWRVCRAVYDGPRTVTLTLYEMPERPGATAFDTWQKSRIEPGKLAFHKGRYFGVAQAPAADAAVLDGFVVAVEATLPPGSEGRW
jgi:hypothetical protein